MTTPTDRLLALPVQIESCSLEGLRQEVSTGFIRHTTVVRLEGGGHEGLGEDVVYDEVDQLAFQQAPPPPKLAGTWTLASLSGLLDALDLFPRPPVRGSSRLYRRWAFESAALDLALRQAGASLAEVLERTPRPVRFVVSTSLGDPPSSARVRAVLARRPELRFKLDPRPTWDDALLAELAATRAVATLDLKGRYTGTIVDNPADPELYRRLIAAFPSALLEDPGEGPGIAELLEPVWDSVTWDAPIHALSDVLGGWPVLPRALNVKPSRFGLLSELLRTYAFCEARDIACYSGGQFELGVGRGQLQYLASLFHPDADNDCAPRVYNLPELPDGAELPASPLPPRPTATGFRWAE
ncbi:MAG: hypothetical protein AB7N76_14535 [Planctomycetota bacterium]